MSCSSVQGTRTIPTSRYVSGSVYDDISAVVAMEWRVRLSRGQPPALSGLPAVGLSLGAAQGAFVYSESFRDWGTRSLQL